MWCSYPQLNFRSTLGVKGSRITTLLPVISSVLTHSKLNKIFDSHWGAKPSVGVGNKKGIMKKIFYFDVETTGLDCIKNDIIQLAGIIEIDGEIKEEIEFKCQPTSYENISQEALNVHGFNLDTIKGFPDHKECYDYLLTIFDKYINKYDKQDKFIPAGYNVNFDVGFLFEYFKKHGNPYCGAYLDYHKLDPMPVLLMLDLKGTLKLKGFKLTEVCDQLGIKLDKAHDALSDIRSTRELCKKILEYLK